MFLTSDFSRRSGDKSSPPATAPLDPTDSCEEKVDLGLHGNLRSLTLEGEEESGQVPPPKASEDTSSSAPSQDSLDGKPLQGMTLEGEPMPVFHVTWHCCSGRGGESPSLGCAVVLYFLHRNAPVCLSVCHLDSFQL